MYLTCSTESQFYIIVWFSKLLFLYQFFHQQYFFKVTQANLHLYVSMYFLLIVALIAPPKENAYVNEKYANSRCTLNSLYVLFIKTMLQLKRFSCYCRRQQHKFSSNMLHIMQYKCYNCWLLVFHTAFAADTSYCSAICCTLMLALPVKLLVLFQKKIVRVRV